MRPPVLTTRSTQPTSARTLALQLTVARLLPHLWPQVFSPSCSRFALTYRGGTCNTSP